MNSRCGDDYNIGKVTCNDTSLIDYCLLNYGAIELFTPLLSVKDFSCLLSDVHCPLNITLSNASCNNTISEEQQGERG